MKRRIVATLLTIAGLLITATASNAQVRYRWDVRYYTPYPYGPAYYYGQAYGWYRPSQTSYPMPFYVYRYRVTPGYNPYPAYYYNPYTTYYYSVPSYYYGTPPSSLYLPY